MIWLISSSIYIVSFCFVYLWLKIAFSKNGIWENTDATKSEMFITILPLGLTGLVKGHHAKHLIPIDSLELKKIHQLQLYKIKGTIL